MPTPTINYAFNLPTVGADDDIWGGLLNDNWSDLDTLLSGATQADFTKLAGVTATLSELNILDGATLNTADLNLLAGASTANAPGLIPQGGIIMWSGAVASIPVGWVLCNGSNGTPDLRDRFVVGAGGDYAVGAVGGANAVTLTEAQMPSHTHTGNTDTSGAHTHTYSMANQAFTSECCGGLGTHDGFSTVTTSVSGAHSHSFTTASSGGGGAHENRPPYYALAYIMKV